MIIVGVTGSIGMGKSTTARMFADHGAVVLDADAVVAQLYEPEGPAIAAIREIAPTAIAANGAVDKNVLARLLREDPRLLKQLETRVHPMVREAQAAFLETARGEGRELAVLDVPLLFETGGEALVHAVVVASAPEEMQRARVLARPGMSEEKFQTLVDRQLPDSDKRARADFVVDTSQGLESAREQVAQIVRTLRESGKNAR